MDPDSQASQNQRRIELQSPEDLAYLISNVRKAATAHLEEALPRIEGQREDRLREDIAALVNQVRYAMLISKNMGISFLLISLYALLYLFFVRFVAARCYFRFLPFSPSLFYDTCARKGHEYAYHVYPGDLSRLCVLYLSPDFPTQQYKFQSVTA